MAGKGPLFLAIALLASCCLCGCRSSTSAIAVRSISLPATTLFSLMELVIGEGGLSIQKIEAFMDPIFVPDIFYDLAPSAGDVLDALQAAVEPRFSAGILDDLLPFPPLMFPTLIWKVSNNWNAKHRAFSIGGHAMNISTVYVDIGAHHWSQFFPVLREDPQAVLVCMEPTRTSFMQLYRRLKMDYSDIMDRVLLLPVAAAMTANVSFGFQALYTNDHWEGGCNSLMEPDRASGAYPSCTAPGNIQVVSVMSLDVVLLAILRGLDGSQAFRRPLFEIKTDAQGADFQIMETVSTSRMLMREMRQVQLEVMAKSLYHGMPLKDEVVARMQDLGFHLRLDKRVFKDGGTHEVIAGCSDHHDDVGTEDCFFFVPSE